MTTQFRIVLALTLLLLLLAASVPPWRFSGKFTYRVDESTGRATIVGSEGFHEYSAGFGFILVGPFRGSSMFAGLQYHIDAGMLLAEVIVIASMMGLVLMSIGNRPSPSDEGGVK